MSIYAFINSSFRKAFGDTSQKFRNPDPVRLQLLFTQWLVLLIKQDHSGHCYGIPHLFKQQFHMQQFCGPKLTCSTRTGYKIITICTPASTHGSKHKNRSKSSSQPFCLNMAWRCRFCLFCRHQSTVQAHSLTEWKLQVVYKMASGGKNKQNNLRKKYPK